MIFTLPEDDLPAILKRAARRRDAAGDGVRPQRTRRKLATGTLATIDNQIDTTTGTVKLRALFANSRRRAVSQPVRQRAAAGRHAARTRSSVPTPAVQHGAPGTFVYLVKPDNTVAVQPVKTRRRPTASSVAITSGLQAGRHGGDRRRRPAARRRQGHGPAERRPAAPGDGAQRPAPAQQRPTRTRRQRSQQPRMTARGDGAA